MKTIWKYNIKHVPSEDTIQIPVSPADERLSNLFKVGWVKPGLLALWCRVDTEAPTRAVTVRIFGTGDPIPESEYDLGQWLTTLEECGNIWHVFVSYGGGKT